ncbi:TPA: N-acetylmuramoyl-L-alanine amidase, partial [Clostridioides difficile]|nr:N-acetylmuramoyl-L-alanine amidase [Clostridioides difficile]HEK4529832.1 N-acetylmuramoyl-L-alanine amidase [Clostridioides difficile]
MKICITVGHSILKNGSCTSADGVVNEYKYNKSLA